MTGSDQDETRLEADVANIARQLWPDATAGGRIVLDGKERDGVFETEECIHIIECTTSRSKAKAAGDSQKIRSLADRLQKESHGKPTKGWFVTREEPTADQRAAVLKHKPLISPLSFHQFRAKLISAPEYLVVRGAYAFGSARNPDDDSPHVDVIQYVHPTILTHDDSRDSSACSLGDIARLVSEGDRVALLGDYGAGKSMTLRELWLKLARQASDGKHALFPILINLRDHHGQTSPAEALQRHAAQIGFGKASHLVRAWRAGSTIVMLDGFDELTSQSWSRDGRRLKENRYRAMTLVRAFIRETPRASGIVVAGRGSYFDSREEMVRALEIGEFRTLVLEEFSEDQMEKYFASRGISRSHLPAWLPSRPLLLGYLTSKGFIQDALGIEDVRSPAENWDLLLDRICTREAEIEPGVDGAAVRGILERIASLARRTATGLGPISYEEINNAFFAQCGYAPDERAATLLQRLPGLGVYRLEESSRAFVDADLASCARAGDVWRYVSSPFAHEPTCPQQWECALGDLGTELVLTRVSADADRKRLGVALQQACRTGLSALAVDLLEIHIQGGHAYECAQTTIDGALVGRLEFDSSSCVLSDIALRDSVVRELILSSVLDGLRLPRFRRCLIGVVVGRVGKADLPSGVFEDCDFEVFADAADTTDQILSLSLPRGRRVLLSIIKKLYLQRGKGRRESALQRGLSTSDKALVQSVVQLLQQHQCVVRSRSGDTAIWLPVRSAVGRMRGLLASPSTADPLLEAADSIGE